MGPELAGIGTRKDRKYILESIVSPSKEIAPGFESVLITMKSGALYSGLLKKEDDTVLTINSPEDGILQLKKSDINSRDKGQSAMPEGLGQVLTRRELRDLVEFLATLR